MRRMRFGNKSQMRSSNRNMRAEVLAGLFFLSNWLKSTRTSKISTKYQQNINQSRTNQ